ncbi:hypothetical protein TNCV_296961 [Trichonephila clavipes]|nr:hypothetical protein TNCV_296961 [Trichonephila clavipes]
MKSFGKPWETLATVGPIPKHLERAEAVARFFLTTGYDFLGVYLNRLGEAANEAASGTAHSAAVPEWMESVVKAPRSEEVFDPRSGERVVSLYWSGDRGRKSAPKGEAERIPLDAFGGSRRL